MSPPPLLLLSLACWTREDPADAASVLLARHPEALVELALPETTRPPGADDPWVPVSERMKEVRTRDGVTEYVAELPFGYVYTGHGLGKRPAGLSLRLGQEELPYHHVKGDKRLVPGRWDLRRSDRKLLVRVKEGEPRPEGLSLRYRRAQRVEDSLDPATAELSGADFALRSLEPGRDARYGALLPAPATAAWSLTLPPDATLGFEVELLEPPADRGLRSDGATLEVEVEVDGELHEVETLTLAPGQPQRVRVDLSRWERQPVLLRLRSDPGADPWLDHVFLHEPRVFTPRRRPRRVVMVFIDTLRADHLGVYGYARPTSPALDAWARRRAAVYTQARSVAPWTLPSARSALTGRYPGAWAPSRSLPAILGEEGFVSVAHIANAFLSTWFGMGEAWSLYDYDYLQPADDQVAAAMASLERHEDEDLLLMIHLFDPHVPYLEPDEHRHRWAGARPQWWEGRGVGRDNMRRLTGEGQAEDEARQWVIDRYDQNVRFATDALEPLLEALDDDALVLIYADHGEEFWDHGGAEHGHSLYDEVIRVPLLIAGEGVQPGVLDHPASLLDLAPTALDALGLSRRAEGMAGRSLLASARGGPAPDDRGLALGHALYEADMRGVVVDGHKWVHREGRQRLHDLREDPGEVVDLASSGGVALEPYPRRMAEALGRPVHPVWRISSEGSSRRSRTRRAVIRVSHPSGVAAAWKSDDPLGELSEPLVVDGVAVLDPAEDGAPPREWYVQPADPDASPEGLTLTVERGGEVEASATLSAPAPDAPAALLSLPYRGDTLRVHAAWSPEPPEVGLPSVQPEVESQLRELGYLGD